MIFNVLAHAFLIFDISLCKEDLKDLVLVVIMLLFGLVILCIPLSFPSLHLAHRLCRKRFLHSVFNQHVAVMMIFSGRDISNLAMFLTNS